MNTTAPCPSGADHTAHQQTGLRVFSLLGIPALDSFVAFDAFTGRDAETEIRFLRFPDNDGKERLVLSIFDCTLQERNSRHFLPSLCPVCWAVVEAWMCSNFTRNQQNHYHMSLLCQTQQQAMRHTLLFAVATAPLEIRCRAFLQAVQVEADHD